VVLEKGPKAIKVTHIRDKLKAPVLQQLFNPVDPSEATLLAMFMKMCVLPPFKSINTIQIKI
jgi:hypothetical protein